MSIEQLLSSLPDELSLPVIADMGSRGKVYRMGSFAIKLRPLSGSMRPLYVESFRWRETRERLTRNRASHFLPEASDPEYIYQEGRAEMLIHEYIPYTLQSLVLDTDGFFALTKSLLTLLRAFHLPDAKNKMWVHKDIKPENILVRTQTPPSLVLIDFGSTIVAGSSSSEQTYRWSSINIQSCRPCSALDDLESLLYVLYFLHRKTLPWMDIKHKKEILQKKRLFQIDLLQSNENASEEIDFLSNFLSTLQSFQHQPPKDQEAIERLYSELFLLLSKKSDLEKPKAFT